MLWLLLIALLEIFIYKFLPLPVWKALSKPPNPELGTPPER